MNVYRLEELIRSLKVGINKPNEMMSIDLCELVETLQILSEYHINKPKQVKKREVPESFISYQDFANKYKLLCSRILYQLRRKDTIIANASIKINRFYYIKESECLEYLINMAQRHTTEYPVMLNRIRKNLPELQDKLYQLRLNGQ